jgi:hypothetical protein
VGCIADMTRPKKQTVDYFPHSCKHGKTMFILEQRYGNDGYAFWFKLLELIGSSEGHYVDCNDLSTWEYLQSITRMQRDNCAEILNLLSNLEAIDAELWESKIIWSENFVKGIEEVYRKRTSEIPMRPDNFRRKPISPPQTSAGKPQSKVKESKGNKSKGKIPLPPDFGISEGVKKWAIEKGFDCLEEHLESFKDYAMSSGKTYADWDAAFRRAIKEDWGKVNARGPGEPKWIRELSKVPSTS